MDGYFEYDMREIKREPYSVLPVEILALRNVRQRLGLDSPWPSHPLLDSPFVKNLPWELPPCQDQILSDVIAAAEKVLPGFLTDNPLHIQPGVASGPAGLLDGQRLSPSSRCEARLPWKLE